MSRHGSTSWRRELRAWQHWLLAARTRSVAVREWPYLLIQSIGRTWHGRILFPRYESFFQRRKKLVVPRPRLPHYPAIVARVIHRALLLLDLMRAVWGLAEGESLDPRTDVLTLDAELGIALTCARDRDVNHVIRSRVRVWQLEGAGRIV